MGTESESEVESKMTIVGTSISSVIYYQLQGHLMIIFNVLFGFSISERTDVAFFGLVQNFGY